VVSLANPAGLVQSVAGRTGAVTLGKTDVGLAAVEDLSPAQILAPALDALDAMQQEVDAKFTLPPGGITEMSLIAEEMGLDVSKIVVMHTVRVLATIGLVPLLVTWFS